MYKALWLSPLRFIVGSSKLTPILSRGRRRIDNGAGCSCSRSVTTLMGNEFILSQDESTRKILQVQIVDALRSGERLGASTLLSKLIQEKYSLSTYDFHDILSYCARSPDPVFVMETYSVMCKKEINLDSRSLLFIVQALCNGGHLDKASDFIQTIGEDDRISPVLPVYNYFLGACAKTRSLYQASKCLELMSRRKVGKNEITYASLLKLAVLQSNLSAVNDIWKHYVDHYSMNVLSLRKFIWSFTRLRDLKSAYELLQHMVNLGLRGELFVKSDRGKLRGTRLDIPIPKSGGETGLEKVGFGVNDHMVSPKVDLLKGYNKVPASRVLRWSFNDVIHACGQSKNSELAEQLMIQMQNLGLLSSSHTYDGFIRAVAFQGGFEYGMTLLNAMQQKNLKPYDSTLATVSAYCSKAFQVDLAEHLLSQISECSYAYPFNNLLEACDFLDQPERAVRVLVRMKELNLRPDMRTYELMFSIFGNVNAPYEDGNMLSQVDCCKRINAIEMDMVRNGFQHSSISRRNVLRALGSEGMVKEMIRHLQRSENVYNNMYFETPTYNIVLHSLLEANEIEMVMKIFKGMKSSGSSADAATYNIMIDSCSIIHSFKSASAFLSMMIRDGFSPQAVTFTALIKILLNDENFEEALNLLDQAALEGIHLDVLSYNTILRRAFEKGMIDVIEYIVEQMHREKVKPDPATCHYVFTCYVERGFHNTAVEALNVLSLRMLNEEDEEKKTEFQDDFVMKDDSEAEVKIIELFSNSEEHLAASLLNLRWCAMLGAKIIWSENQSSWSRRLSDKYG